MATVTKSWTWNSDLESWVATVGGLVTLERSTTYYHSASGALYGYDNSSSPGEGSFDWKPGASSTDGTWETFGVPAGGTVTAVEVSTVRTQGGLGGWTRVTYCRLDLELTCDGNTHDLFYREAADDGSWLEHTQASKNGATMAQVSGLSYASNETVALKLKFQMDGGVGSSRFIDVGVDNLSILVTYTPGTELVSQTLQDTYNVRGLVSQTLQDTSNVRGLVSQTLRDTYDILEEAEPVSQTLQDTYNVRGLVSQTLQDTYNVRALVSQTLRDTSNVSALVSQTLRDTYDLKGLVSQTLRDTYNLSGLVSQTYQDT